MLLQLQTKGTENANCKVLLIRSTGELTHPLLEPLKNTLHRKMEDKDNGWITWYGSNEVRIIAILKDTSGKAMHELLEEARSKGGQATKKVNYEKMETCQVINLSADISEPEILAFVEGMYLANYQFLRFRSEKKVNSLKTVIVDVPGINEGQLSQLAKVVEANFEARNLINEPVLDFNATELSAYITEKAEVYGFKCVVLSKMEIEQLGMGGLLGVNKGSKVPPTFNILEYTPKGTENDAPVVLVGKGVMYDTGGYSLKPAGVMATMKCDMSGAAAVVGTFLAVVANQLNIRLVGLIPATDNRVNSEAIVPDDILTMSDGTTVEVLNTDAEGRLILADALHYAKQYHPRLVIDLATLTGSAMAITGNLGAALMGTDTEYRERLIASGNTTFERIAEIPYWKEFGEMLKGDIAYLKNIGGPIAGAATAGKFLEHFTGGEYPWLHLDIAGPAFLKEDQDYKQKGAAGFGVRLLYDFLAGLQ